MKNIKISLAIFLFSLLFVVSCRNPISSVRNGVTGRVLYVDSPMPASGAKVWLGKTFCYSDNFHFYDSTHTNSMGYFTFEDIEEGHFCFYACKYSAPDESDISHITPLYGFSYDSIGTYLETIFLNPVFEEGKVTGNLIVKETQMPADSAKVILIRLDAKKLLLSHVSVDSVLSDSDGSYSFENVRTGTYYVYASKIDTSLDSTGFIYADCDYFYSDGKGIYTVDKLFLWTWLQVYKPAIYIYPEENDQFKVKLILKNGTKITKSIPEYKSGWDVSVEKSGKIDSKYDYLFYETSIKKIPDISCGWCISQKNLRNKLNDLLMKIGLNEQETEGFLDYWLDRLQDYKYYKIFPVVNRQLEDFVELEITPPAKTSLRVWFFFQGCDKLEELPSPQINKFVREGTTVIEWGGVMLN